MNRVFSLASTVSFELRRHFRLGRGRNRRSRPTKARQFVPNDLHAVALRLRTQEDQEQQQREQQRQQQQERQADPDQQRLGLIAQENKACGQRGERQHGGQVIVNIDL